MPRPNAARFRPPAGRAGVPIGHRVGEREDFGRCFPNAGVMTMLFRAAGVLVAAAEGQPPVWRGKIRQETLRTAETGLNAASWHRRPTWSGIPVPPPFGSFRAGQTWDPFFG